MGKAPPMHFVQHIWSETRQSRSCDKVQHAATSLMRTAATLLRAERLHGHDRHDYMRHAIDQARKGDLRPGSNPIGCVIVSDGRIVAEGCNEVDA